MRRPFEGHRTTAPGVGGVDFSAAEAQRGEQVEPRIVEQCRIEAEPLDAESLAQGPFVERKLDVEGARQGVFDRTERRIVKASGAQALVIDGRRPVERAVAQRIALDRGDLGGAVAQRGQRLRHGAIDDLEIAAAGELLEFDKGEIGLDAGRVAIHDEPDRSGRRDHGRLRVAVPVPLTERQGAIPGLPCRRDQRRIRA